MAHFVKSQLFMHVTLFSGIRAQNLKETKETPPNQTKPNNHELGSTETNSMSQKKKQRNLR